MKMTKRLFALIILFIAVATTASYAQQTGTITGTVYDSETNEPMVNASVAVDGTTLGTTTDAKGNFSIKGVPAGTHNITITYVGYADATQSAAVGSRTVIKVDIFLHSAALQVEEVVVYATSNRESEGGLLVEQKEAFVVVQTVGASEMSRKGTGDAEAAVAQVSGVSKQAGEKNVFVRGLGDRYNRTLLNGFPVPSEDPEYKNIALEFFATDIIKNIGVSKVFSADNNGDVGGAAIDINSKELSGNGAFSVSIDAGINSRAIGAEMLRPDGINFFGKSNTDQPSDGKYDFANKLNPRKVNMPLNNGFSISGGKRFLLGGNKPLSFLVVASNATDYSYTKETVRDINQTGILRVDQTGEKSSVGISQLVLANVDFIPSEGNRIAYNFMLLHANEQYVGEYHGKHTERNQDDDYGNIIALRRQQSNDNLLITNQLTGKFMLSERLQANIGMAYNNIRGMEPDRRENQFSLGAGGRYDIMRSNRQQRFFSELNNNDINLRANLRWALSSECAIEKSNITVGYKGRFADSKFNALEYNMGAFPGHFDDPLALDLDELYNDANYQAGEFTLSKGEESNYHVLRNTHTAFIEFTHKISEKLYANMGVQADVIDQSLDYYYEGEQGKRKMDKLYVLPNLNIRYDLNDKNTLRLGASKSYIMPQPKEIAPYKYVNIGYASQGNPNLKPSDCYNVDLKWDYFPTPLELISVGVFYKYIVDPMGRVDKGGSAGLLSYENLSRSATVAGVEFELRKNVFDTENAGQLNAGLNASYIFSRLELDIQDDLGGTPKRKTGLEGASPLILNSDITYNLRREKGIYTFALVANYTGDRINTLGTLGYEDIIEKGTIALSFVSSYKFNNNWGIKLKVGNLLDPSFKLTQKWSDGSSRKTVLNEYKKGVDISLGISFNI